MAEGKRYRVSGRSIVSWEVEVYDPTGLEDAHSQALTLAEEEVDTIEDRVLGKGRTHEVTGVAVEDYTLGPSGPEDPAADA